MEPDTTQTRLNFGVVGKKQTNAKGATKLVKRVGNFYLHHKSLLNDPILQPRKLDTTEDIFEIIMPWLPDQAKEELEKRRELGMVPDAPKKKVQKQQATLSFMNKGKKATSRTLRCRMSQSPDH